MTEFSIDRAARLQRVQDRARVAGRVAFVVAKWAANAFRWWLGQCLSALGALATFCLVVMPDSRWPNIAAWPKVENNPSFFRFVLVIGCLLLVSASQRCEAALKDCWSRAPWSGRVGGQV